jgi:hypothetical protein
VNLSIDEVARLHLAGELEDYENAVAWSRLREREQTAADIDDLEPVDRGLLLNLHGHGVDVTRAYGHSLQVHGEGEPRRVIRTFPSTLRLS